MSDVEIRIDNRIRLVGAVLAAGAWPAYEQEVMGAHAVHPHAKATRRYLAEHAGHPAVAFVDEQLRAEGVPGKLFAAAVRCRWPTFAAEEELPDHLGNWVAHLADFYVDTAIAAFFWAEHEAVWAEAANDLHSIFKQHDPAAFLERLCARPLRHPVVVVPNLLYPALQSIAVASQDAYHLILPPPKAVGASPPWPYRDGVDWVLAESCFHLVEPALADTLATLAAPQRQLLRHAATVLFLEEAYDEAASLFYLVRARKEADLPGLPAVVEALRAYRDAPRSQDLQALLEMATE